MARPPVPFGGANGGPMTNTYSKVFIDPKPDLILTAARTAATTANSGHKARLAKVPDLQEIWNTNSGRITVDGGGVVNPRKNTKATTSRLGLAWWTDENGRKHVRVCGDRCPASRKPVSIFGKYSAGKPDFWCVYPKDAVIIGGEWRTLKCKCGRTGNVSKLGWDGTQCRECRSVADYEQETGFIPAVGRKRRGK